MTRREQLIERYRDGYRALCDALDGVDLDARPGPDEWSPREIVHHVADAEVIRAVRLRRLLAEPSPEIAGFDQDAYARRLHYERGPERSLETIRVTMETNIELLDRLADDEWARTGTHAEFGRWGVEDWLARAAEHANVHAEQIKRCGR